MGKGKLLTDFEKGKIEAFCEQELYIKAMLDNIKRWRCAVYNFFKNKNQFVLKIILKI